MTLSSSHQLLWTLVLSSLLAACGGGGSDGDQDTGDDNQNQDTIGDNQNSGREVSAAAFMKEIESQGDGVWRSEVTASLSDETRLLKQSYLLAYDFSDSGDLVDFCQLQGFEPVVDPDSDDYTTCIGDGEESVQYFISDSGQPLLRGYCDGRQVSEWVLTKLSSDTNFDHGALNIAATIGDDVSASDEVCGRITSGLPALFGSSSVSWNAEIVAPYTGGERVRLRLTFVGDPQSRTYTVVESLYDDHEEPHLVEVDVDSTVFGGSEDSPGGQSGYTGTVTISEVTDLKVSGSLDLQTNTGNELQGSFSLDMTK